MYRVRVDESTFLEVDFRGLLSPREEEVTAWRFLGKSKAAVSKITGTTPDTVNKQSCTAYEKAGVGGTDSPLALLMVKSFKNGWARFVVATLLITCVMPAVRTTRSSINTVARREASHSIIANGKGPLV